MIKFAAAAGNPPYQCSKTHSPTPIYQKFCKLADRLNSPVGIFIIPCRWFGPGYENLVGEFRHDFLKRNDVAALAIFPGDADVFPLVKIAGGVCYYLIDAKHAGLCSVEFHGETTARRLDDFNYLIADPKLNAIAKKIWRVHSENVGGIFAEHSFSIPTTVVRDGKIKIFDQPAPGRVALRYFDGRRKIGYIDRGDVRHAQADIDRPKVFTIRISHRRGNGEAILAKRGEICSQTFRHATFDSEREAESFKSYLNTGFVHGLIAAVKNRLSTLKAEYSLVPGQDWRVLWTDERLAEKYGLTSDELAYLKTAGNGTLHSAKRQRVNA